MKYFLAIMAILLVAIPIVLAEDSNESNDTSNVTVSDSNSFQNDRSERLAEMKQQRKDMGDQARERIGEAKEKAKEAREKLKEIREVSKESLKAKTEEIKSCKNKETDTCKKTRTEAKDNVQNFIIKTADKVIALLTDFRAKITESETIAKIDSRISEINAIKENSSLVNMTKEEVLAVKNQIQQAWPDVRKTVRLGILKQADAKIKAKIDSAKGLEAKLDAIVVKIKENNSTKVSEIEAKVAEFKAKVAAAAAAETQATGDDEAKIKAKLEEANNALKDANKIREEIVKLVKEGKQ